MTEKWFAIKFQLHIGLSVLAANTLLFGKVCQVCGYLQITALFYFCTFWKISKQKMVYYTHSVELTT